MNKRIKELIQEASEAHLKTLSPATDTIPRHRKDKIAKEASGAGIEIISDEFCEKFAILIVKECSGINYNSSFQDSEFHARELLEHFGIEE
jgi:hypothetical protein